MNETEELEIQKDIQVQIYEAEDLQSLNALLTEAMSKKQIQEWLKGDNLELVVNRVLELVKRDQKQELYASAMLGRLAAVARGRESIVLQSSDKLFTQEPDPIDSLSDGDEKDYAAKFLSHVETNWWQGYCLREILAIDSANNARKELIRALLARSSDLAAFLKLISSAELSLKTDDKQEIRLNKVRRILESLADVIRSYDGDVGSEPGLELSRCIIGLLRSSKESSATEESLNACLNDSVSILVRIIELRFSHALQAETYLLLQDGKKLLTLGEWTRFLDHSNAIQKVRLNLLETVLVLARQNRTDRELLRVMEAAWPSTQKIGIALKKHFAGVSDVDPEVADYWLKVGRVSESARAAEHKLGNTEDHQIGELLIQLDANRINMNKLNRAVVPVLETFDPIQAATVRRAANGYESIAQVAERLARMRKLSKTDLLETVVEYNPIEHEMEGGHRTGIRRVKVVRDGILKEFGGKKKTLVKPRVEADE